MFVGAKDVGVADEEGRGSRRPARGSALIGRANRPNGRLDKAGAASPKGLSAPHQRAEKLARAFLTKTRAIDAWGLGAPRRPTYCLAILPPAKPHSSSFQLTGCLTGCLCQFTAFRNQIKLR